MISIPHLNDPDLKKLIQIIDPSLKPVYIPVEPETFAKENECFPAVQEKIKRCGGSQMLGWQIWQSDFLIEAESHAIWKSLDEKMVDVTPKYIPLNENLRLPISQIVFLQDSKKEYDGKQVDNIRLNTTNNPVVDDFIKLAQSEFKILNKGERALKYEINLSVEESRELKKLQIYFFR